MSFGSFNSDSLSNQTWAEMFTAGRKIGKMYTRGSERTKWFAIVFKDNSRLGYTLSYWQKEAITWETLGIVGAAITGLAVVMGIAGIASPIKSLS